MAVCDLKPGQVILNEPPLLRGPSQVTEPVCLSCLKGITEEDSKPCPMCGWPLCLDAVCRHSSQHAPECQWAVEKRRAPVNISLELFTVLRLSTPLTNEGVDIRSASVASLPEENKIVVGNYLDLNE